jgi:diguanylate cyclase (GGDEF)-like protein
VDDCTGLYNARHLYDVLGRELERCTRLGLPVSLAFIDLDKFKQVNDVHGHLVGSELLARTGRRLQQLSVSRTKDLCFRYGGDEFVILMPETSQEAALAQAGHLLQLLRETNFAMKGGLNLNVSASIGVASSPRDGYTVHAIIGTADARMYRVKTSGRGKVHGA